MPAPPYLAFMQALDCHAYEWAENPFHAHGEVGSVAILFFRLLLKNTERCPQTAVSLNFFAPRGSHTLHISITQ